MSKKAVVAKPANDLRDQMMKVRIVPRATNGVMVINRSQSKWAIVKRPNTKAYRIFSTKGEAMKIAKEWVKSGKSEYAVVMDKYGNIKERIANAI